MKKKLSEMTLKELWALFPILLTEHNSAWKEWYQEKEALLKGILPEKEVLRISHIGSTAVSTIWARQNSKTATNNICILRPLGV